MGSFRRLLVAHREQLYRLMEEETSKSRWEAMTGDFMPLLASCRWHERHARRLLRPRRLGGRPIWELGQRHAIHRRPRGHVAIIATWNYPTQLVGIQLIQALVAGNTVVVKPSENAPRTQRYLLRLAVMAGLPEGTLRWTEVTREAGHALLKDNTFDHVIFTGSTTVGREIAKSLATSMTTSTLELSGRDSAFVLADADPKLAAKSIWTAVVMNGGQTCMAPRRILVEEPIYRAFLDALSAFAGSARPRTLISSAAAGHVFGLAKEAVECGARSLSGVIEQPAGPRIRPLAIVDCPEDAGLVQGDHFGPVTAVVPVRDLAHAMRIHRQCDQHLAVSIYTRDARRVGVLKNDLIATTITINDTVIPTGHPAASIGGSGASGWGESRGREGLLAMTNPVHVTRTSRWLRPEVLNPSAKMEQWMDRLITWLYGGRMRDAQRVVIDDDAGTDRFTTSHDTQEEVNDLTLAGPARNGRAATPERNGLHPTSRPQAAASRRTLE